VPTEQRIRLQALSEVTGLSQWRIVVEAIDCLVKRLSPAERERVDGLSERLLRSI
jgi:predicted DNA-binding protein